MESKKTNGKKKTQREKRLMAARRERGWGVGNMGEGDLEIQTFSCKVSHSWENNI